MSIDSPVAADLIDAPQQTVSPPAALSRPQSGTVRSVSPLVLAAALALVGAGVVSAVTTGANVALSVLVGYAALVGTIALTRRPTPALAPAPQPLAEIDAAAPEPPPSEPIPTTTTTTAAWKLVTTFTISDASRLLCNVEPGAAATQETLAWGRALLDAVKQGDLPLAAKAGAQPGTADRERDNPHYMSEITREALRTWADRKGSVPEFLRD